MKLTDFEAVLVVLAASLCSGIARAEPIEPTPGVRPIPGPPALAQPSLVQPSLIQPSLVQPNLFQPNLARPAFAQSALSQPIESISPPAASASDPTNTVIAPPATASCPTGAYHTRLGRRWHTVTKPHLQYSCWGYADLFIDRPFGSYMRGAVNTQINNGLVAQLALYQYDFLNGDGEPAAQLSPRGRRQLDRILHLLQFSQCPIVIEATADSRLNELRRASVLADVKSAGIGLPEEAVVVGEPRARGMDAVEAIKGYRMMLQSTGIGYGLGDPQGITSPVGSGLGVGFGASPTPIAPSFAP